MQCWVAQRVASVVKGGDGSNAGWVRSGCLCVIVPAGEIEIEGWGWMGSGKERSGSCACFKAVRKRFISFRPPPRNETQNTRVAEQAAGTSKSHARAGPWTRRAGTPNIHFSNSNFSFGTAAMPVPIGMGQSLCTYIHTYRVVSNVFLFFFSLF